MLVNIIRIDKCLRVTKHRGPIGNNWFIPPAIQFNGEMLYPIEHARHFIDTYLKVTYPQFCYLVAGRDIC